MFGTSSQFASMAWEVGVRIGGSHDQWRDLACQRSLKAQLQTWNQGAFSRSYSATVTTWLAGTCSLTRTMPLGNVTVKRVTSFSRLRPKCAS